MIFTGELFLYGSPAFEDVGPPSDVVHEGKYSILEAFQDGVIVFVVWHIRNCSSTILFL